MNKITLLLLIFFLSFSFETVTAQSHNLSAESCCKIVKRYRGTECSPCPACGAEEKKENDAKAAENKRRTDIAVAKAKAEKELKAKERAESLKAEKEKANASLVTIEMPKSNFKATNNATKVKSSSTNIHLVGNQTVFYDAVTGTQYKSPWNVYVQYYGCKACSDKSPNNFMYPYDTGIVAISKNPPTRKFYYTYDLADSKFNRMFNDPSIVFLEHIYGNWFVIGYYDEKERRGKYDGLTNVKVYNIVTKQYRKVLDTETFARVGVWNTNLNTQRDTCVINNYTYSSGVYNNETDWGTGKVVHCDRELLLDELSGGRDKWKAGFVIETFISDPDESYLSLVIMDQNEGFKTFKITGKTYEKYTFSGCQ